MSFKTTITEHWHGEEVKIQGQKAVSRSAFEIGLIVEGQAKLLCPVNWGYLAASITTQAYNQGNNAGQVVAGKSIGENPGMPSKMVIDKSSDPNEVLVGTPVFYGPYAEFGTFKMNAQPFLRPAFELAKGRALSVVKTEASWAFKEYLFPTGTTFSDRGGVL